jgi:hypothetical protein
MRNLTREHPTRGPRPFFKKGLSPTAVHVTHPLKKGAPKSDPNHNNCHNNHNCKHNNPMEESAFEALGTSLAAQNEWISSGILVQAHESIDPSSEASEVDIASTMGFPQVKRGTLFDLSNEASDFSNFVFGFAFRILSSNLSFEFEFRIVFCHSNFSPFPFLVFLPSPFFLLQDVWWFPATYNSKNPAGRSQLQQHLARSCHAAGFTLVMRHCQTVGKGVHKGCRMSLRCSRGRLARLVSFPLRFRIPQAMFRVSNSNCEFELRIFSFLTIFLTFHVSSCSPVNY